MRRHVGVPLWSRGPHSVRRPAVRSYCGRTVRDRSGPDGEYRVLLPHDEVEDVAPLDAPVDYCLSCFRAFRLSIEWVEYIERCARQTLVEKPDIRGTEHADSPAVTASAQEDDGLGPVSGVVAG